MKVTKVVKGIFITIWTGIFLAAACLIVKGGTLLKIPVGNFVKEAISLDLMKENSTLFEYNNYPFVSIFLKDWPLLKAVEGETCENNVLLEFQDEKAAIDYSVLSGNVDFPIITGESYYEKETKNTEDIEVISKSNQSKISELKKNWDPEYLLRNFYVVDGTTSADTSIFDVKKMLEKDFSIEKTNKPQILIYHTHGQTESFSDSIEGKKEDSIIGVGEHLKEILEKDYGYQVMHDETPYDVVNGSIDRNKAYNQSLDSVQKILDENPSIQVIIDLHRDGISGKDRRTTVVNGKETARIMLFNGLSRNKTGPIDYLKNPNLFSNLSFSLQLKLKAMDKYPNLTTPNYLKGYRYNLHLAGRSLLVELGNQNNTVEEAMNAMEPLADILNQVLE